MKPGDPVRGFGWYIVCRVKEHGPSVFDGTTTVCLSVFYLARHTGTAATHRKDGTAYPLCEVCWPKGEIQ